jgi:hypothetical protein
VIRLVVPLLGVGLFFACSWATVRFLRPREPRRYFFWYALVLLIASALVQDALWPLVAIEDAIGLVACLLLQAVVCLTMWNAFYSLLWGFSGSLMHDLYTDPSLRDRERLVRSYQGDGAVDRILARRLPNLVRGGWIAQDGPLLRLMPKGRVAALVTLVSFRAFSLGMGGGIK